MANFDIQSSFSAGELSKSLFGRVDLDKYQTGAARMENFFVDYRGGASTRPGTELNDRAKQTGPISPYLFPFIFSQSQSYLLELGDNYMRFYSEGQQLLNPFRPIATIANSSPALVQDIGHGLSTGAYVFIENATGMVQVNGKTFIITVIDANHFTLATLDGAPYSTISFPAYTGGGQAASVYELVTPWAAVDLPKLKWAQSADVITFTHNNYPIYNLTRTSSSTFSLLPEAIGPVLPAVTGLSATTTLAGTIVYQYIVVPVTLSGVRGAVPASPVSINSAPLNPVGTPTPAVINISWTPVTGADHYDIFKTGPVPSSATAQPTVFGYIGTSIFHAFPDNNIGPDFADNPPDFTNPFSGGRNPGCVAYFQQRRGYGNINLVSPEALNFSKPGAYSVFDTSFSSVASDAIEVALTSRQENAIVSMVPTSTGLIVFTSGGAFLVSGGSPTAAITPATISALPQASTGANDLRPLQINYDILYIESKGSIVRDFSFNFYTQSFYGFDRSALSNHLFFGFQLTDWDYAEEPFKIIWVTRNDGRALALTFMPEQEVYGWSQHYTQGAFTSICVIPEGDEHRVYFTVERQFGSKKVYYIERMASRKFDRIEDAWFVDCALSLPLDRPVFSISMTGTIALIITANSGTPFDSTWLNKIIWFDIGGKLEIIAILSSTRIEVLVFEEIGNRIPQDPVNCFDVLAGAWEVGAPVSTISGLDHLAGMTVTGLADGMVIEPTIVSASGTIELISPSTKVIVGLPYTCNLQTLYLDAGEPTIQGKRKRISAITIRVDKARGLSAGQTFNTLTPIKEAGPGPYSIPPPLLSSDLHHTIAGGWDPYGQVCIQQNLPLPASVLGIIGEFQVGDDRR